MCRSLPWAAAALVAYWLALFIATHLPNLPKMGNGDGNDKVGHFVGYAVLAFLASLAVRRRWRWSGRLAAGVFLGAAAYGVADELLQIPIPGRRATLADWLADCGGAAAGVLAFAAAHWGWSLYRGARRAAQDVVLEQS